MKNTLWMKDGQLHWWVRGEYIDLMMEWNNRSQGLFRVWIQGEKGRMKLGILVPEGNMLCLQRTLSMKKLQREGCWPIQKAGVVLHHRFTPSGRHQGWLEEKNPARLFYGDPILRDALAHVKYSLFYPLKAGFRLAFPYQRNAPFVLLPIFCFAKVRTLGGGEYIIFSFDEEGKPKQ